MKRATPVRLFTALLVIATFLLISAGGTVTSQNAGLAVPDWPTSFGRWFFIPLKLWSSPAIFAEHTHRVIGAVAGLIAIGAYVTAGRMFGFRSKVGWLAAAVLVIYVIQGLMGGLRVTEKSIPLAIVHGVNGQVVFALTVVLATVVRREREASHVRVGLRTSYALLAILLVQLIMGALIRHTSTASAIPDAPLVYGGFLPPTSQEEIGRRFYELGGDEFRLYVHDPVAPKDASGQEKLDILRTTPTRPAEPPKMGYVHLQWLHRVFGFFVIPGAIVALGYRVAKQPGALAVSRWPLLLLGGLWIVQALLGMSVIWSRERWEIATGHQAVGALFLAVATWLAVRLYCTPAPGNIPGSTPGRIAGLGGAGVPAGSDHAFDSQPTHAAT